MPLTVHAKNTKKAPHASQDEQPPDLPQTKWELWCFSPPHVCYAERCRYGHPDEQNLTVLAIEFVSLAFCTHLKRMHALAMVSFNLQ